VKTQEVMDLEVSDSLYQWQCLQRSALFNFIRWRHVLWTTASMALFKDSFCRYWGRQIDTFATTHGLLLASLFTTILIAEGQGSWLNRLACHII
jgi:hypothetical protein